MPTIVERHIGYRHAIAALLLGAAALAPGLARADDLVAATLPSSRSAMIGETVTAFATVINTSGRALGGCAVSLTGFPVTLDYTATDPATNLPVGSANTPFSLAVGASQTLVLALTPSAAVAAELPIRFGCTGATAAASIPGLDTLLLSASATQPPDVVALVATPSNDGVVRMNGLNSPQAFAVATVNLGIDAAITVSADTGGITLPATLTICQSNPMTAVCLSPPAPSVTLDIPAKATPTFSVFVDSSAALPFAPATTRAFVRFKDASNVARGATSVALTNGVTVPTPPTGGGIYEGQVQITGGAASGQTQSAAFIVSETGRFAGVTAASLSSPVNALFTGTLAVNTALGVSVSGQVIAAPGMTLPDGPTSVPMTTSGTLSPASYIAGQFTAGVETGIIIGSYNAGLYQRTVSLGMFAGTWNLRDSSAVTGTMQVAADGSFTGTGTGKNNAGCQYSGQVSLINSNFNAESITLTIANCGLAGNYSGLAALFDFLSTDDTVVLGLSSGSAAAVTRLTRF